MQGDHLGSLIAIRMCGVMRKDAQDKFLKRCQGTSWPVESHVYCQGKGQTHIYGFGEGELGACETYGGTSKSSCEAGLKHRRGVAGTVGSAFRQHKNKLEGHWTIESARHQIRVVWTAFIFIFCLLMVIWHR